MDSYSAADRGYGSVGLAYSTELIVEVHTGINRLHQTGSSTAADMSMLGLRAQVLL